MRGRGDARREGSKDEWTDEGLDGWTDGRTHSWLSPGVSADAGRPAAGTNSWRRARVGAGERGGRRETAGGRRGRGAERGRRVDAHARGTDVSVAVRDGRTRDGKSSEARINA